MTPAETDTLFLPGSLRQKAKGTVNPRIITAAGLLTACCAGAVFAQGQQTAAPKATATVTPEAAEFFETQVRPVLAENCFRCHGPKQQKNGMRLDSQAGVLKGGDTGAVVVPGDPEASRLVRAIRYDGPVQMPPAGKLSDKAIAALTAWVEMGAPWPEEPATPTGPGDAPSIAEILETHWSLQPVKKPAIPKVRTPSWPSSPIDHFILAKLEEAGLKPSSPADRRTLIRRAHFDLIGLPPAPEEVEAFVASDPSSYAFAEVVDRLLASPRYGERWGRYWLDVARYADTKGRVYGDREETQYPFPYTYRDYVIRAFNEDLPYDQFLTEQLAADCLPQEGDKRDLAAMGFVTLGNRFLNNVHEIINDRLDVVIRGTQALTIACARCHDHKFDPIPTADYYSLYGVFSASTEEQVRLIDSPERTEAYLAYEKGLQKRLQAVDEGLEEKRSALSDRLRRMVTEYLLDAVRAADLPGDDHYVILEHPDQINPVIVRRWLTYLYETSKQFHPIFAPWHAFADLSKKEFDAKAPALAEQFAANADPERRLNPLVAAVFSGPPPSSMHEVAERYGELLKQADQSWHAALKAAADGNTESPTALTDPAQEALRQVLYGPDAPANIPPVRTRHEIEQYFFEPARVAIQKLQTKVDKWNLASPAAPPHALVLQESSPTPPNPRVFLRGDPKKKGDEVPRQFLVALSPADRQPFQYGSGRLELARAITRPDNPVTARVMVNRIWMRHFGEGLVRTPSDFGTRGESPSHPELLDYLAWRFMESGWSIKNLHRLIMLSKVYRQSSGDNPEYHLKDSENRLLWRMNPRRLDFESTRDALLEVSGQLDTTMGGRSVSLVAMPFSKRRTVYGFIDRLYLPGMYRTFDFPNPDLHSPQRSMTTVPLQALFMMNSLFVVESARAMVERPDVQSLARPSERIARLYHLAYQREPTEEELMFGLRFLESGETLDALGSLPGPRAWQYGYGEVDEATHRVKQFQPLPYFTGAAWQGVPNQYVADADGGGTPFVQDKNGGGARLTAVGGQPGKDLQHAVIRRWVAPRDGVVTISGTLHHVAKKEKKKNEKHEKKEGDGVRARIISGRVGLLGSWTVKDENAETNLQRVAVQWRDTIDFVVDCRSDEQDDAFHWAPVLRLTDPLQGGVLAEWSAQRDFAAPLTVWQRYAQALLLVNEFVFVD